MCKADEKYRTEVDSYLRDDSPVIFGNYSKAHAEYVTEAFLRSATESIVILSGRFPEDFYCKDVERELCSAINRLPNGRIRIVTLGDSKSSLLERLAQGSNGTLEYRPGRYTGEEPLEHFMVVDGKRYRLEKPHPPIDSSTPDGVEAEICCNGTRKAKELLGFFDKAWAILAPRQGGDGENAGADNDNNRV